MREDWIEIELLDCCHYITDGSHFSPKSVASGMPYITVKDVLNDKIEFENCKKISQESYHDLVKNGCKPEKDDLLFSKDGTVGKVAVVDGKKEFVVLSSLAILKTNTTIVTPQFLFYVLKSQLLLSQALKKKKGVAIRRIILRDLKRLKFNFAPLPEQRAIVAKIEQLFSELDNGIANLKAAKDKLDIYRQAVLKKAFEGELTNSKIIYDRIGEYVSIISGNAFKKAEYSIEGVRLFQIANVSFNEIVWDKKAYLPSDYLLDPKIQHLILKEGDIVMALNRPMLNNRLKIGRLSKNDVPSILYQRVGKFVFQGEINPKYFLYFLQSSDFTKWLSEELRGVNIPFINQTKLLSFDKLPIVELSIQNAIVQEIESRLSVCDNILANIEEGLEKSEALRQSILKQAFEGKLLSEEELEACRREPDWEPAEKLLERIKNKKLAKA